MGEDLDLSWRCQVAGSRVVVAPDARVRHREAVAGGLEPLAASGERRGPPPGHLQMLQRRHELRAVLKCYTRFHLVRVLPQAALLAFGEVVVAVLARDRDRVRAVAGAWRWNARRLTELSVLRGELAEHRLFPDAEVRRLQLRGSARLSRYFSRLSHQGLEAANAVAGSRERPERRGRARPRWRSSPAASGRPSARTPTSTSSTTSAGAPGGTASGAGSARLPLSTGRQRAAGRGRRAAGGRRRDTASCSSARCRSSGQLAPLPSWSASWHHFFSGWQSAGVGTTAPASPAFGIVGVAGTVLFGAMGTLQRVLLLGCIPLGAWGVSRFMRPLVSPRARVVAVICYLGLPLPYGALGTGRWDGLVAYAAFPFIVLRLARAAGVAPFAGRARAALAEPPGRPGRRARRGHRGGAAFAPAVVPARRSSWRWPGPSARLLVGARDARRAGPRGGRRGASAVALVLAAPWVVGTALAGKGVGGDLRAADRRRDGPGLGRGDPLRRRPGGPLARRVAPGGRPRRCRSCSARGIRLAWAAPPVGHGLRVVGPGLRRHPRGPGILRPLGDGRAGPGGARRGGLRRPRDLGVRERPQRAASSAGARSSSVSPSSSSRSACSPSSPGRRRPLGPARPGGGAAARLPRPPGTDGVARVLWLGDPRALPVGGWSVQPGLAYALTPQALPDAAAGLDPRRTRARPAWWPTPSGWPCPAGRCTSAGCWRRRACATSSWSTGWPPPGGHGAAVGQRAATRRARADLLEQDDLQVVPGELGVQVYENGEAMPVTASGRRRCPPVRVVLPGAADVVGWQPVLSALASGGPATGAVAGRHGLRRLRAGRELLAQRRTASAVPRQPAFGWAAQYAGRQGPATLSLSQFPYVPLAVLLELAGLGRAGGGARRAAPPGARRARRAPAVRGGRA